MTSPRDGLETIDRVADLLAVLAESKQPPGMAELAERACLPISTVYRLVQALERHGFVKRRPRRGVVLGLRMLELAQRAEDRLDRTLLRPARFPMEQLARDSDES